ncbi:hypothetical protein [Synechococcus sp. CCY 0621]|nr:hypothetical protein [Synechococcus sp. CCY 0621]
MEATLLLEPRWISARIRTDLDHPPYGRILALPKGVEATEAPAQLLED